jgi:hypothetical protein
MLLAALGLSLVATLGVTAPADAAPQHRVWCC